MKRTLTLALAALGCARLAYAAEAPPTGVVQIDHAKIEAAFQAAMPGFLANSSYKVSVGRRTEPGNVEVHAHDTDIFYVLEGSATFVTGGTVQEPKDTGPGEIRGTATTGGETHHLAKNDIIVVPKGTPHWFTEVNGPFVYFVVKVTE
jgi:mannose-6-phosphate isomerase-like protein (cupin superfamily)